MDKTLFKKFLKSHESISKQYDEKILFLSSTEALQSYRHSENIGMVVVGCTMIEIWHRNQKLRDNQLDIDEVVGTEIPIICYPDSADPLKKKKMIEIENDCHKNGYRYDFH